MVILRFPEPRNMYSQQTLHLKIYNQTNEKAFYAHVTHGTLDDGCWPPLKFQRLLWSVFYSFVLCDHFADPNTLDQTNVKT